MKYVCLETNQCANGIKPRRCSTFREKAEGDF